MKKLSVFIILLVVLGSCNSHEFKIDGNIAGIDGVRIVFSGDSGMVDEWVSIDKKGRFSYKGTSADPVLVSILDVHGEPVALVVAADGEASVAVALRQFCLCLHYVLTVRCRQAELAVVDFKKEVGQDGQ